MRLGVLTGTFHPESGGVSTYLYHLLPLLQASGHEVRVVTYGDAPPSDYGYSVRRISRTTGRLGRFLRFIVQGVRLARWSDTLFVPGYLFPLLIIRLFWRGRVVAKIVSDHSWEFADRNTLTTLDVNTFQTAPLPWKLRLYRALYLRAARAPDAIIVPSEHVARLVRGWGVPPQRVHVIYNAIPDPGLIGIERAALRHELGLPPAYLLVSVARLTPVKGVDVALEALKLLPDCVFVVVGDGEQQDELEKRAPRGRVHFVGRKPHDVTLRFIRAADVFVLSSRTEGLSHVLLEALAVGTPAVATRVGGNPEILTHEVDGLLVPSEDPAALATAIERYRADPGFAARVAAAARVRSAAFSWDHLVERTVSVLLRP